MLRSSLHVLPDDIHITVDNGTTISEALQKAGIILTHPCGCIGVCGKCIVISDGKPVKACTTCIEKDMVVEIPAAVRLSGQTVLTNIRLYNPEQNVLPLIEKLSLFLDKPSLENSIDDVSRLKNAIAKKLNISTSLVSIETSCLKTLPHCLREKDFDITVNMIYENNGVTVLSLLESPIYGIAVDIGTTTIAAALCNLSSGDVLTTVGIPNPQAEFGSDVISRIVFSEENKNGLQILQKAILSALSDAIITLTKTADVVPESIVALVVAANTTMSHFLLGLPADFLRREPYTPVMNEYPIIRAVELGLPLLSCGRVLVIPSVSSYVGGDITAGVIATNINKMDGLHLLVDVGTNGEMVLAGDGFMVACSCSAGPAFEGSGISCGSRAVTGAIDNVYFYKNHLIYDVIGGPGTVASSLCGSGLISFLSALLQKGVMDRSGRFTTADKVFKLTDAISITESDVQNLIRSKAAIYAGMRTLLRHLDLQVADVDKISIAGGFGRHLNIEYASNIGMFPLREKSGFEYVGNSALAGAIRVLNDRTINAAEIAASITNFELSVGNEFMDEFTKACFLPHTDSLY